MEAQLESVISRLGEAMHYLTDLPSSKERDAEVRKLLREASKILGEVVR